MEFDLYSINKGLEGINATEKEKKVMDEFLKIIKSITDDDLMNHFSIYSRKSKSLSKSIKTLIEERLNLAGWEKNLPMFTNNEYRELRRFSLDFYKDSVSIEFAFNHESACAWKLIKSSLISGSDDLDSNKEVNFTVLITVDKRMRNLGGFDGAIGTYEKYITYAKPMRAVLDKPIILLGLKPSKKFKIRHTTKVHQKIGEIKTTR